MWNKLKSWFNKTPAPPAPEPPDEEPQPPPDPEPEPEPDTAVDDEVSQAIATHCSYEYLSRTAPEHVPAALEYLRTGQPDVLAPIRRALREAQDAAFEDGVNWLDPLPDVPPELGARIIDLLVAPLDIFEFRASGMLELFDPTSERSTLTCELWLRTERGEIPLDPLELSEVGDRVHRVLHRLRRADPVSIYNFDALFAQLPADDARAILTGMHADQERMVEHPKKGIWQVLRIERVVFVYTARPPKLGKLAVKRLMSVEKAIAWVDKNHHKKLASWYPEGPPEPAIPAIDRFSTVGSWLDLPETVVRRVLSEKGRGHRPPRPRHFDLPACLVELQQALPGLGAQWIGVRWRMAPVQVGPEEARFWLYAFTSPLLLQSTRDHAQKLIADLEAVDYAQPVDFDQVRARVDALAAALSTASPTQLDRFHQGLSQAVPRLVGALALSETARLFVESWPPAVAAEYLGALPISRPGSERDQVVSYVEGLLADKSDAWLAQHERLVGRLLRLAPVSDALRSRFEVKSLGLSHEEVMAIQDDGDFVVAMAALLEDWMLTARRSGLEALLVRGGLSTAPLVVTCLRHRLSAHDPGAWPGELLGWLHGPELVPEVLSIYLSQSPGSADAGRWLRREGANAIVGLFDELGPKRKRTDVATDLLRGYARGGHASLIRQLLEGRPKTLIAKVESTVLDVVAALPPELPQSDWPAAWEHIATLELPLFVGLEHCELPLLSGRDHQLPRAVLGGLLSLVQRSEPTAPAPGMIELVDALDPISRSRMAWSLFERWVRAGHPPEHRWALYALGWLGDDEHALKLARHIHRWPFEYAWARATWALEVYRILGSDTALMVLAGVRDRIKYKSVRKRANELMAEIAEFRGLSEADLLDRTVPDCGLDASGTRELDYGSRTLTLTLGHDLKPVLRDSDGHVLDRIPTARKADDPAKVELAKKEWRVLSRELREVLKTQKHRLEAAMIDERRWTREAWLENIVSHPVLSHVARRLVWRVGDLDIRISEDGTFADFEDETIEPTSTEVTLVHPASLAPGEVATWSELFADYEILQPFPQLGRPVHPIPDDFTTIHAEELVLGPGPLQGMLARAGWTRGPMEDEMISWAWRRIETRDLTAVIQFGRLVSPNPADTDPVPGAIGFFQRGSGNKLTTRLPLTEAGPVLCSELRLFLQQIHDAS